EQHRVLHHEGARQQQAECDGPANRSEQHTLERIGRQIAQEAEVEERAEEVFRKAPLLALGKTLPPGTQKRRLSHGSIRSRICRATGVKSSCPVVLTKTSSSDRDCWLRNSSISCSAATRPLDRMTTREQ